MKTTKPKSLMKRLLTFTAVLGLVACGTGVASAQSYPVLFNGDLNQITLADTPGNPPVGWTALGIESVEFPGGGWTDCEASEPWCNGINDDNPTSGYGIFIKAFEGSTNADAIDLDNLASMYFYQDNPSSANTTYTLSAYVGAGGTYSGFNTNVLNYDAVSSSWVYPVTALYVVFIDGSGGILQSNSYDLIAAGLETTGNLGTGAQPNYQYTTPVYTAPAGTVTVRAGLAMLYQWGGTADPSLFADDFDLEATAAPGSPVVTTQPNPATVALGGTATFYVGTTPAASTYEWTLNNNVLSNVAGHISGSGTATLTITGVTTNDVGHYQAAVSNGSGLNRSAIVPLAIETINLFPTVGVTGFIGDTYQVQRSSSPGGPWTNVTSIKLTTLPQYITDFTLPVAPNEFYQAVYVP